MKIGIDLLIRFQRSYRLISEEVALETIEVRIKYRLKFPGAVIAATGLVTKIPINNE